MSGTETLRIVVVCTGNICRSPMAHVMVEDALERAGLDSAVRVESCGTGGWHVGQGADPRAIAELKSRGLDGTRHRASQFDQEFMGAQLYVVMDESHRQALRNRGVAAATTRLIRSFDPSSPAGAEVADPYYGSAADFTTAADEIDACLDGIVAWARRELEDRSER